MITICKRVGRCGLMLILLMAPGVTSAVTETDLQAQRKLFVQAQQTLRAGNLAAFQKLAAQLSGYPLYPYLLYDYLRPRLWKLKAAEISAFLSRYGDLPTAGDLRRDWLRVLAQRGQWQAYVEHYTPQSDTTLQCYHLLARLKTGNEAYLLEDARTLWLSARSQPPQCDAVFTLLDDSDLMTDELVWSRIKLAMAEGGTSLATFLGNRLGPVGQKWVTRWIATHHNPARWTQDPGYEDTDVARSVLLHGIRRLAQLDIEHAIPRWQSLREKYGFTTQETAEIDRLLAVRAAQRRHKRAKELLGMVDNGGVDEEVFNWRLRIALQDFDWPTLRNWTEGHVPEREPVRQGWLYWRARALEQTGGAAEAGELYRRLSGERDYYAFMAADHLGIPYDMKHHPLPEDLEEWQRLVELPALQRARELYRLGMTYSAGREWQHALSGMTTYQMQIAAMIAANWGWHHRVILTMAKAQAFDDLVLRFPVPYEEKLREYAGKRKLDLAWVFAVVRAESAFLEDARSPAGALGLMQVMPATGKETARTIGWNKFAPEQLLKADTNIPIGTAYLKHMFDHYKGNIVLATAAYNAGPGNVSRWIPRQDCMEPDAWIELIPITETRKYVQRILYYSSVYDWRLRQDVVSVRQRMAAVQPRKQNLIAALGCMGGSISMN